MARTQAADYSLRRKAILDQAARLYATRGFLGASIADLAKACHMTKSLIYHYYGSKEEILFDVMHSHMKAVLETARSLSEQKLQPKLKIRELTRNLIRLLYTDAVSHHRVLLNELYQLPTQRRKIIVGLQRELVVIVEDILAQTRPPGTLPERARWPSAMFFVGMLNWTHTWLDPQGPLGLNEIADLASELILKGIEKANFSGLKR